MVGGSNRVCAGSGGRHGRIDRCGSFVVGVMLALYFVL